MRKLLVVIALVFAGSMVPQVPAEATNSAIDQRYNAEPELQLLLGPATTSEWSTNGGRMREYKWGALYYSAATGVHEVHGAIRWEFRLHGGLQVFGFPTTDEQDVFGKYTAIGRENLFQHGDVTWDETTGAHWMDSLIGQTWHENIYPYLYMPTSDQQPEDGGAVVHFYDAAIHESFDGDVTITLPEWALELYE